MPHIFRTRRCIWLTEVIFPTVFILSIAIPLAIWGNSLNQQPYVLPGMLVLGWLVMLHREALPRWNNRLIIDNYALSGRINTRTFTIPWSDVLAVAQQGTKHHHQLLVGTAQGSFAIPLHEFDAVRIWHLVQLFTPVASLHVEAYKRLPSYQKWAVTATRLLNDQQTTLRATIPLYTIVGVGTVVLFLAASIAAWLMGQAEVTPFLLIFVALGLVILLFNGVVEMDTESICYCTVLGLYRITWSEVRRIETDVQGQGLVLIGDNKQLALPGPPWWAGPNKEQMIHLLEAQIEQQDIPIEETQIALYRLSRNAKVR